MSETPASAIKANQISEDFLDRIAFDVVHIPPLRVRRDDIAPLISHFGRKMVSSLGAERFPGLTPEATNMLMGYSWPGNIRELKNVIERSVSRAYLMDETLSAPIQTLNLNPLESPWESTAEDIAPIAPATVTAETPAIQTTDFTDRVMVFERGLIDEAMTTHNHHQGKAADYLGLSYHQFRGLLRKHGMKK